MTPATSNDQPARGEASRTPAVDRPPPTGDAGLTTTGRLALVGIGGRLVLGATTIRIEHAGLLRRSNELPRSLVRTAVGDPAGGRDPLGRPARFMLTTTLAAEAPADLERSLTALGFGRSLTRADLDVVVAAINGDFHVEKL